MSDVIEKRVRVEGAYSSYAHKVVRGRYNRTSFFHVILYIHPNGKGWKSFHYDRIREINEKFTMRNESGAIVATAQGIVTWIDFIQSIRQGWGNEPVLFGDVRQFVDYLRKACGKQWYEIYEETVVDGIHIKDAHPFLLLTQQWNKDPYEVMEEGLLNFPLHILEVKRHLKAMGEEVED